MSGFVGRTFHVYLHVLQCTYIITMIRQGSQRAVCMWDKYNMDIVQSFCFISPAPSRPASFAGRVKIYPELNRTKRSSARQ